MNFYHHLQLLFKYNPDSFTISIPKKKKVKKAPQLPQGLSIIPASGQIMKDVSEGKFDLDLEQVDRTTNYGSISPHLTSKDMEEIEARELLPEKALELKPIFAAGASINEAAQSFHGKRGYSASTIKSYWAAFNAAKSDGGETNV